VASGDGCEVTCLFSCRTAADCAETPDDPCTTDACETVAGGQACRHVRNDAACDDGNPCTSGDACNPSTGACAGTPIDVDRDAYGPGAACGGDCDDGAGAIHPGAADDCNGVDDDCNGATDDGPGMTCRPGSTRPCLATAGATSCAGTEACDGTTCTWTGDCTASARETCNGADDDCDEAVDEDFVCARSAARPCTASGAGGTTCDGVASCLGDCSGYGACAPTTSETCDGRDDDCDTEVDEIFSCARGATAACTRTGAGGNTCSGTKTCGVDCTWETCVVATPEACNRIDDDCDLDVDEDFACSPGWTQGCLVGSCPGVQECGAGCAWGACTATTTETCNGADDDCDTTADEDFACVLGTPRSCTTTCGTAGVETCVAGCRWGDCAGTEACANAVDDDCDTTTDEGCLAWPCAVDADCSSVFLCNERWGICVVASCAGEPDFRPCEAETTPDRSYDICVDGACVSPGCGDATCNVPGPHFPPGDTGQDHCYDNAARLGGCPGPVGGYSCGSTAFCGQDAQYGWDVWHTPGLSRFTRTEPVGGEPVVTDNATALVWQGCLPGQTASLPFCAGTARGYDWAAALAYCDSLAWGGFVDWRLPDRYELQSIVHFGTASGSRIDPSAFPGTPASGCWSSSSDFGDSTKAWAVDFAEGYLAGPFKSWTERARCVRGGPLLAPAVRFTRTEATTGAWVVSDAVTGLMWQGCPAGSSGDCPTGGTDEYEWQAALDYCQDSEWGGFTDWYLPSVWDLSAITDDRRDYPTIDPVAFPGTGVTPYWTSTTNAAAASSAWYVMFVNAAFNYDGKTRSFNVRCVRRAP
jgi:hypothetical protein